MGTREPVLIAGGFASLLAAAGALAVHYGWMAADEVGLWIALLTIVGTMGAALWARSKVVSEHTIKQTGNTLETVQRVANDPKLMLVAKGTGDGGSVRL